MKKKLLALVISVMTIMATTVPALAATPTIEKTEYEGAGYVEVDFTRNVQYKNAKVSVKDSSGKSYKATIKERDVTTSRSMSRTSRPGRSTPTPSPVSAPVAPEAIRRYRVSSQSPQKIR